MKDFARFTRNLDQRPEVFHPTEYHNDRSRLKHTHIIIDEMRPPAQQKLIQRLLRGQPQQQRIGLRVLDQRNSAIKGIVCLPPILPKC